MKLKRACFLIVLFFGYWVNAQEKPNVLFIIVDDWGYHDLSANGSVMYNTPNVDDLAKNGFVFQNAYASYPRCVPSRYAILTGTYPLNENKGNLGSTPTARNFPKQFADAGYNSFYVGKWHLGSGEDSPTGMGFKSSFAAGDSGGTDSRFYPFNKKRTKGSKGEKAPIEDVEEYANPGDYLSDVLTKRTIEYIKENKNKPFMGVLAYYAVHTPIEAKEVDIKRNEEQLKEIDFGDGPEYTKEGNGDTRMKQNYAPYAALVENVDENIGKLIETLKAEGIYNKTLIVLTSDHGGLSTRGPNNRLIPTSNAPLRAGKGWIYEGGTKVPLIFKLPNGTSGVDTESIVMGMDVFPTIIDLALNKKINGIDGISVKGSILGKEIQEERTVFWNSYKARPQQTGDDKTSAIRIGDYKLLQFVESGKVELYNVAEDISEQKDLSQIFPEKAEAMVATLEKFKKDKKVKMKANHKGGNKNIEIEKSTTKNGNKKNNNDKEENR
ncbi:sulfatase-like hydrolase/transferase [Aegicerativicinus sediminis]|uniref:sulfatase-like hydrolase/transferase n=1 Tax=Aegicerativicinus sediminis TaxID=2893202 RepID=UPI001E2F27FA|nr:sulfatase-like hydrolase/transferase [Aegicerativicinus sediminis]